MYRAFNLICKNCGIQDIDENIGLHSLRHTFISMMCRKGVDKMVIASIVGQSDTKTIERVYYHVSQEEKDKAMRAVEVLEDNNNNITSCGEIINATQLAGLDIDSLDN